MAQGVVDDGAGSKGEEDKVAEVVGEDKAGSSGQY